MSASSELTADEALDSVVSVGRAIVAALGTSPWVLVEGPGADDCTRSDGTTGVSFTWAARGPASTDLDTDGATAKTVLEQRGYVVYEQKVPHGANRIVGRSDRLGVVEFDAAASANGIQIRSSCVVGKSSDYDNLKPEEPEPSPSPT